MYTKSRVTAVVSLLLLMISGTAPAAEADAIRDLQATVNSPTISDPYAAAMQAAAQGDIDQLERLLSSPMGGEEMRSTVARWLQAHPTLGNASRRLGVSVHEAPTVVNTGQYEVSCQGYNGQFYGWYGKEFLACHGYLDTYISGSHVGHYIPDLFPRGRALSVECAKALGAGGLTALGTLTSTPTGPLGWAAVAGVWSWTIADITVSCRHL